MPSLEEFINNPPPESPVMNAIKELRSFDSYSEEYRAIAERLGELYHEFDAEHGSCICDLGHGDKLNDQNCLCCLSRTLMITAQALEAAGF